MIALYHPFTVGDLQCAVLSDGLLTYDLDKLAGQRFPDVPREALAAALAAVNIPEGGIPSAFNMLMVRSGEHVLLADTGNGPGRHASAGKLPDALAAAGLSPGQITTVVITHAHGDHILGLVRDGALAFPNARVVISRAEWAYWTDEARLNSMGDYGATMRGIFDTIAPKTVQIDPGTEIIPGVLAQAAPGHTPGHLALMLKSESGDTLLNIVDTLHVEIQFAHPEWSISFDSNPEQSRQTRRAVLEQAADSGTLTLAFHLPFPGLGHVERDGVGFRWVPLV